jgi:hypothetical protein
MEIGNTNARCSLDGKCSVIILVLAAWLRVKENRKTRAV